MIAEFIIDKNDYQTYIKNINLTASNGLEITKKNKKAKGRDIFYLNLSISENNIKAAQALSEIFESVNKILIEKNVKFYVLTNEASQLFVQELYPLACQFETTLRKFIYCAIFDVSEKATDEIVEKINKTISNKEGRIFKNTPHYDLLSNATFEQIFNFLFSNDDFFDDAKQTVNQIVNTYNRRFTKDILIREIEKIEENTIWNKIFAEKFSDSILPQIHELLIGFRNDIMHFHYIDYQTYQKAYETFKKGIDDLNTQTDKQIIIEATEENVKNLSSNSNYIYDVLKSLKMPRYSNPTMDMLNSFKMPSYSNPTLDMLKSLKMPSYSNPTLDMLKSLKMPGYSNPTFDSLNAIIMPKRKKLDSINLPETISPIFKQEGFNSLSKTNKTKNIKLGSISNEPTDDDIK